MIDLQRIARMLSDDGLVSNLVELSARLDRAAARKVDADEPALHEAIAALREEYRTRTGEII